MSTKLERTPSDFRLFVIGSWIAENQERAKWNLKDIEFSDFVASNRGWFKAGYRYSRSSISRSSERYSFQRDRYLDRIGNKTDRKPPAYQRREQMFNFFQKAIYAEGVKFMDKKAKTANLEYDLRNTSWILEKVRESDKYAQNLYAALCNNDFQKLELMPILKEETWSCSWRYAGGIIADMKETGDYIDWYCSGMGAGNYVDDYGLETTVEDKGYVGESVVTEEIESDLKALGWIVVTDVEN